MAIVENRMCSSVLRYRFCLDLLSIWLNRVETNNQLVEATFMFVIATFYFILCPCVVHIGFSCNFHELYFIY